jgi:hypothetical protein
MAGRLGLRVELNALRETSDAAQASRGEMTTPWNYFDFVTIKSCNIPRNMSISDCNENARENLLNPKVKMKPDRPAFAAWGAGL